MKKIIISFIFFVFMNTWVFADDIIEIENHENTIFKEVSNDSTKTPKTLSKNIIVIDRKTLLPIYEKDAYTKAYPASTTKIMTAILALENCNLTDTATVSHNAIYSVPLRICTCLPKRRRSSNN